MPRHGLNGINAEINAMGIPCQRTAKRSKVLLKARLLTPEGESQVRLRDLSRRGALVDCQEAPPIGTEVLFARGSKAVAARVAWATDGRMGLEFLRPVDRHEILSQPNDGDSDPEERAEQARAIAARWAVEARVAEQRRWRACRLQALCLRAKEA